MAERDPSAKPPDPIAECRIIGKVAEPVFLNEERGESVCRIVVSVYGDKFSVFARGDKSHMAVCFMRGDMIEVKGTIRMVAWTVPGKSLRARMSVEATEVNLLCRKEPRLNS